MAIVESRVGRPFSRSSQENERPMAEEDGLLVGQRSRADAGATRRAKRRVIEPVARRRPCGVTGIIGPEGPRQGVHMLDTHLNDLKERIDVDPLPGILGL